MIPDTAAERRLLDVDGPRSSSPAARAVALTLALGALVPLPSAQEGARPRPPDVLMIVIDDLNDWVGCLGGNAQVRTPNIDRLAERGVLFTNAHAPAPACNPSRTAVFTGMPPHRSGIYLQSPNFRDSFRDVLTLPQRMQTFGYRALGAGKVFHKPFPDPPSWDSFFPDKSRQIVQDSVGSELVPAAAANYYAIVEAQASELGDGKTADWVAWQLQNPPDEPLFLVCGLHRPHVPWIAPADCYARFPLAEVELPPIAPDDIADVPPAGAALVRGGPQPEEASRAAVRAYLASIAFADDLVGRLVSALDASPRAKDTLVILWSDNGFHLGQKGNWGKLTLWEESTHVPLVIVAPEARAGGRCARAVSLQDLYPTVVELCGFPPVDGIAGRSLVPLLREPDAPWNHPVLTTWGRGNHSLRTERWRYTRYADGSEELYDHRSDGEEWHNLAGDPALAAVKAELAAHLPAEEVPDRKRR